MLTREEHLERAKEKALRYADAGEPENALASLEAELQRHPGTRHHPWLERGLILMRRGRLRTRDEMRRYIAGFH